MINRLIAYEFETVIVNVHGEVTDKSTKLGRCINFNLDKNTLLEMVEVPGGKFLMGSPECEDESRNNERPQHLVNVPGFFIGKFPVTQAQRQAVMQDLPQTPQEFRSDELPVVNVWWERAQEFCGRLSQLTGQSFRLPSEAEWEYACRAGSTTPFNCGLTITPDISNYNGNRPYSLAPKGKFRERTTSTGYFSNANAFGLFDFHGNVWEWCAEVWHADYHGAPNDGTSWMSGGDQSYFVQRGGCWSAPATLCRSAFRVGDIAHNSDNIVGLRVCMSAMV